MADNQEKLQSTDIDLTSSNQFLTKLSNFWYYHKWKVIVIAFFAIVIIVGVVQMATKTDPDIEITVATHTIFYKENVDPLDQTLNALLTSDLNGDGKKSVQLNHYKIYSESEMKAANEAEKDENGKPIIYVDESNNKSQIEQFNSYIATGQGSIMIVSEYLYNERNKDLWTPISEIYGDKLPEGVTTDGYGIWLKDTGVYQNLDAFRFLPKDSIICIVRPMLLSGDRGTQKHEAAVEYFKTLVEFGK